MNIQTMTLEERERLAYAEGFTEAAKLLARIDELECENEELRNKIDELVLELEEEAMK